MYIHFTTRRVSDRLNNNLMLCKKQEHSDQLLPDVHLLCCNWESRVEDSLKWKWVIYSNFFNSEKRNVLPGLGGIT